MIVDILKDYAGQIRQQLRANPASSEPALAPKFQALVEAVLPTLDAVPDLTVAPEFTKPGVGRPDIALIREGQLPRAFIELKAPAKPADPKSWNTLHDKRQRDRLKELANWSTSNFHEFRLFGRDKPRGKASIVPTECLDPETSDKAADAAIDAHDSAPFLELLAQLARAQAPAAGNAQALAELLAHSARIVRSAVRERIEQLEQEKTEKDPLVLVKKTYRNVLYAHPEAGGYSSSDFNQLFSSAFAQTLAFGLLLVREHLANTQIDEEKRKVGPQAWQHMPDEHPLMKGTLEAISHPSVIDSIGIGFDVMRDCVNSFDPAILAPQKDGRDPILYFYEDFLTTFDPDARERYGVYYTPLQVVRFMVGALDRVLRDDLGTKGLHDSGVTILDPATGTGTFLLGIAERVREKIMEEEGGPAASLALKNLAGRMFGFELLIGPYAVAHYRLHHALSHRPPDDGEEKPQAIELPRLGVYLTDTLSRPDAVTPMGQLGIQGIPIDEEREKANEIKARDQILAIIGNPPYKRLEEGEDETLVGRWMNEDIWPDLKQPVKDAGKGGQLNTFPEFSVAFWRWAMWKLFEAENAPKKGVVAFITNRKFLTGWPYAGLRKMMRERFDRLEIIDLRGDVRAGVRGDVERDQGVFNIQVGTAVCVALADGSKAKGALADVRYRDAWEKGAFSKKVKLDWLEALSHNGQVEEYLPVERGLLDDFRPEPFQAGNWVSIADVFLESSLGIQSKRDKFVYAVEKDTLDSRLVAMSAEIPPDVPTDFNPTPSRPWEKACAAFRQLGERVEEAKETGSPPPSSPIEEAMFRPLDKRHLIRHTSVLDRQRPKLQSSWGASNICLYTMPSGVGLGPATWCHSLLPDYHAFRGSFGGYALPLYDRRKGADAHNFDPAILAALAEAYGEIISPEDLFDAILALLSATSYTVRFAEDLEDTFPHIPFPADPTLFHRAAAIGREIRALEGFGREPASAFRSKGFVRLRSEPNDKVDLAKGDDGEWIFCADGSGRFDGLPPRVWEFAVSGYRVLKRWVEARKGLDGPTYWSQFRDIAARIHELLHWFDEADLVLAEVLEDTLSREELGLAPEDTENSDD
ncbi:MAG: type ISP restriction/modification enzyme [Pseudomonadota bacterium]